MTAIDQAHEVALAGNTDFVAMADPYRAELLAYCYRLLGSLDEAEDQVQETLLRAWRSYADFEGRSSLRTWLYRIATNSCLRALETRRRRPLPAGLGGPADDADEVRHGARADIPWLQPFPDAILASKSADPASIVTARASTRLALIAALQYLPARQRAVLILRDVLGWHAVEVADLLGVSTAAANSVLQRARAHLAEVSPAEEDLLEPSDPADRALLDRYAAAFESADVAALTEMLREDATFEMPPMPYWFAGRERIGRFLGSVVLTAPGLFALVPTAANGQAAFAAYMRAADGSMRAHAIQVLTVSSGRIAGVVSFNDGQLPGRFGLPDTLAASTSDHSQPAGRPGRPG